MSTPSEDTAPGARSTPAAVISLRPLGTSLPLSFLGLALASVTFAAVELGWLPTSQASTAALVGLLVAVPLQGLAAVFGLLSRDAVAGTGGAVLAATWGVTSVVTMTSRPGARSSALGVFLLAAAVAAVVPVVAGLAKPLAAAVMALSGLRFAVTGAYDLSDVDAWRTTAGVVGLLLTALAFYAALAFELEGVHGRPVLPVGRTSRPSGPPLRDEPGVRNSL